MRRSDPTISVVIPACDQLGYLRRALDGVRRQTFADLEVLVIDDASTDGTREWCRRQDWPALRYFRLPKRRGTPGARNRGVAAARGKFVAFLDHDDVWYPAYLETLLARFRSPRVMMAAANVDIIDGRDRVLLRRAVGSRRKADRALRAVSGLSYTPCMSACVFRRRVFIELGGFDEGFTTVDDLDLFYRVALRYGPQAIVFVDRALGAYRLHARQQTAVYGRHRGDSAGLARSFIKEGARDRRRRACLLDMAYFYAKHAARLTRLRRLEA